METKDELEEMKSFYDDVYYADANKPLQGSAHLKNLAVKMDIDSGVAVLDIACGLGEWLHVCATDGAQVFGVDLSERAIDYCRKHMPDGEFHAQTPVTRASFYFVMQRCAAHAVNGESAMARAYPQGFRSAVAAGDTWIGGEEAYLALAALKDPVGR